LPSQAAYAAASGSSAELTAHEDASSSAAARAIPEVDRGGEHVDDFETARALAIRSFGSANIQGNGGAIRSPR